MENGVYDAENGDFNKFLASPETMIHSLMWQNHKVRWAMKPSTEAYIEIFLSLEFALAPSKKPRSCKKFDDSLRGGGGRGAKNKGCILISFQSSLLELQRVEDEKITLER